MCGRYLAMTGQGRLFHVFDLDGVEAEPLAPNPNVAPTEPVPAVAEHDGRRVLVTFRWGLIPSWAGDRRIAGRLINARAETVADKPAFRQAFRRRRCLLPADGWYEWERRPDGTRRPWRVAAPDGGVLAFAGLWEVGRDPAAPDAPPLRTCTVLTTAAADPLAWLHDRMPVALPRDTWDEWLDRDQREAAPLRHLLGAAPAGPVGWTPAPAAVGDPRVKDLDLLEVGPAEQRPGGAG